MIPNAEIDRTSLLSSRDKNTKALRILFYLLFSSF